MIQNRHDREDRVGWFAGGALVLVLVGVVLQFDPLLGMVINFGSSLFNLVSTPTP